MFIGLGKDMSSIDFGFTLSKVKVTAVLLKMISAHFFYLSQKCHSHADWPW